MARLISTRPVFTAPLAAVWTYSGRSAGKDAEEHDGDEGGEEEETAADRGASVRIAGGRCGRGLRLGRRRLRFQPAPVLRIVGELGAAPRDAGDAGEQTDQRRRHDHHQDLRERHRGAGESREQRAPSRPRSARRSGRAGPR